MNCWGCSADAKDSDFCPKCGRLQPLPAGERDYYRVLGFPVPLLTLDPTDLENRFHAKSREVHPDRFGRREPSELEISLERSALLNDAYRTLRNQKTRIRYAVGITGAAEPDGRNVPTEMAELYFDLQDLLREPGQAGRLKEVRAELEMKSQALDLKLNDLSSAWDQTIQKGDRKEREGIAKELQNVLDQGNYAESMLKDLKRRLGEGDPS